MRARASRSRTVLGIGDAVFVSSDGGSEEGAHLHACALLGTGEVWCWGQSDWGDLGDGRGHHTDCSAHDCSTVPVRVALP